VAALKPLRFTRHALEVIAQRELKGDWVETAVRNPEWTDRDNHDPTVERRFLTVVERDGRILRVACVETATEIRIISAFLDRRARRPA
jgi:hypothetical protein